MKSKIFMGLALLCMTGLCAYGGLRHDNNAIQTQTNSEAFTVKPASAKQDQKTFVSSESAKSEQDTVENAEITEPENPPSEQIPWQVSICPDMPEPYIEVLKQYESYLNACAVATDAESVLERLRNGEWQYVFYEIGICTQEATPGASLCYALKDLTGDDFPELIVAKYGTDVYPYAVYSYSEEKGVKMFDFKGLPRENGDPEEPISEAEYLQIAEKYAAEPMRLKWNPLVYDKTNPWYFYGEDNDLVFEHDLMSSRDGQGFHWWIYLEATYIMGDYGRRIGYDFLSDHWTVEHIWPIEGGYYNILLSQDNHDVVLDLLCQPGPMVGCKDRKYVVLYAQYENGDRKAGYNDMISYDSQLEWQDFDYNVRYETPSPSIENPFADLYETSIYQPCCFALYQYEQETGYDEKWQIRQIFGRAPFWDYLLESDNGFLWICSDLDYFTYVPL